MRWSSRRSRTWASCSRSSVGRRLLLRGGPPRSAGFRLMMPLHYIHAAYVRSHFNAIEVGAVDAPKPDEILFALGMATGPRPHSRLGGLLIEDVVGEDGQR